MMRYIDMEAGHAVTEKPYGSSVLISDEDYTHLTHGIWYGDRGFRIREIILWKCKYRR